jgi:hypothetical protein
MNDEDGNDEIDFAALIKANARDWNGFWYWRDKPIGEQQIATEILRQGGVEVTNLVSRREDPPDCEATLDGHFSGIEVTELVHQKVLERALRASKDRQSGKEPERPEAYFIWDRKDFLSKLQALIDAKDQISKIRGGPYERYVLVIHTDEFFLDRGTVDHFLDGAMFRARFITDALLGLSYHPSDGLDAGCCPVFRLNLTGVSANAQS